MAQTPKTKLLNKEEGEAQRKWYVADVSGKTLGRAATIIASVLRGKHKPTFTPHVDMGDFDKIYYDHTLFPGGIVRTPAGKMLAEKPEELIKRAVWGMLPKGPLGRRQYKKLKVYAAPNHDHTAQQPETLAL